jgi:Arc/MetJ-type ribon-helix-helix transcriptional regulator
MKKRVTVSLSPAVEAAARAAVESGHARSVSAYIEGAVQDRATRDAALHRMDALWGPPDPAAEAWARRALGVEEAGQKAS